MIPGSRHHPLNQKACDGEDTGLVRGRYAPSPTGLIHLGNARTALVAWLSARSRGGTTVWRLEDLDGPRVVAGMAEAALEDLEWLGLDWDEGRDGNGPFEPYAQSARSDIYEEALEYLHSQGRLFPCRHSRKDLQGLASAPHGPSDNPSPYPASLRQTTLAPDWYEILKLESQPTAAIRFAVNDKPVRYIDRVWGNQEERVDQRVGDFVLKRRDGLYAYQLAVVVDDIKMQINEVVRGVDLLSSTARQIQLFEALGGHVPQFAHVPLVLTPDGEKISKRDGGMTIRHLRSIGITAPQVTGYLAWSLGLIPNAVPCGPVDLVDAFAWEDIRKGNWILPSDIEQDISKI